MPSENYDEQGRELMLIHCDRVNQHTDSMCKLHEKGLSL